MENWSRIISGGISLFVGLQFGYKSFQVSEGFWWLFGSAIFFILVGIFILFNNKEDEIERIKYKEVKKKTGKK